MKKICLILGLMFCGGVNAQIVNNSGSLASDSIALPFTICDSGCYKTLMLTASDSIFIYVFRPGGAGVVFKDSVIASNTRVVKDSINNTRGAYAFRVAVADIDGAGADGVFSYNIVARDVSLGLDNPTRGFFQLYQNSDFNVWATRLQDSTQGIIDSLQRFTKATTDSLQAIIDTFQTTGWNNASESWDDDNIGGILDLKQLAIRTTTAEDTGFFVVGSDAGPAVMFKGGAGTGQGLWVQGAATGTASEGLLVQALATNENAVRFFGGGTEPTVLIQNSTTGAGLDIRGGLTSGDALALSVTSGKLITGISDTLQAIIDSLQRFTKVTTDSLQAVIDSIQNKTNWAIATVTTATNVTTVNGFAANSITATATADDFTDEIVDSMWNEPVASHQTALSYGDTLIQQIQIIRDTLLIVNRKDPYIRTVITAATTPTTTAFTATALTGTDDSWTDGRLVFVSGNAVNQPARVQRYIATQDSVYISPAFSTAPAAGDSFYIIASLAPLDSFTIDRMLGDTLKMILDTLQLQDNQFVLLRDTLQGTIDSLQLLDEKYVILRDTAFATIDTLQNQDNWIARETSIADSVWMTAFVDIDNTLGSVGDSAQGWGATAAGGTDTTNIKTMFTRNWTSAASGAGWMKSLADSVSDSVWLKDTVGFTAGGKFGYAVTHGTPGTLSNADMAAIADSVWKNDTTGNKLANTFGRIVSTVLDTLNLRDEQFTLIRDTLQNQDNSFVLIRDTIYAIIDTLQSQDNIHVLIRDSVYATLDTLQRFTKVSTDSIQAIIDTLQLQDNIHVLIRDSVYASLDTLQRFTKPATDSIQAIIDSAQGLANRFDAMNKRFFPKRGIVAATSGTTGFHSTVLTEAATDYWKNNIVIMVNGIDSGQAREIRAFTTATDSITFYPALTTAPATGDSFYITSFISPTTDTLFAVIDSLQRFTKVSTDSIQAILDTVQLQDNQFVLLRDTLQGVIDTLQNHDNWVARETSIADSVWMTAFVDIDNTVGSVGDSAQGWGATAASSFNPATDSVMVDVSIAQASNLISRIADSVWKSNFVARTGVAGSIIDSADTWGATAAGGTDTSNIKIMLANNPVITSGRQVMYRGVVAGTTPDDSGFVVAGGGAGGIDLTKLNDFYNEDYLIFYSGALRGKPGIIRDWVTATDSLVTRFEWGVQTDIDPAIGDSFIIVEQPIVNVDKWAWETVAEPAAVAGVGAAPIVDIQKVNNDETSANNLGTAFGTSASWAGTNWRLGNVTTVDSLYTLGTRKITDQVADTGQDLHWDSDEAVRAALGISGRETDSTCLVRYFSLSGNNSDGKTWATAWNTLANLNGFWKNLSTASNYDGMNIVYVSADSFNFGGAALCTLYADNSWLIGAGNKSQGRPASIWYKMVVQGDADTVGDDLDLIRIFGDNCHILNMTLCAFDTVGDPDPGGLTGGNNAITFDTVTGGIQGGEVAYCYFPPPNHKPLQMHSHGTTKVAKNLWFHHNIFDHPQRHGIDAWIENGIIEDNIFISHAPGDIQGGIEGGAIQLLGTAAANAKGTVVRNNTFHFSATGVKLVNTDSNIVINNVFNRAQIPWTISFDGNYRNNMLVGNKVNIDTDIPLMDGGLIANPSFENWKGDKYTPLDWGSQNGTIGFGGRSEVHWEEPRTGGWAYNLKGTTSGTPTAGFLDTKLWHLSLGKLVWSGWMRGDPVAPSYDTIGVTLYKDKTSGDSTVITWTIPEVDTLNYNKIGKSVRINSEGDYYLRFSAPPGSGISNEVFIDDMDAFLYADTIVAGGAGGNPAGGYIDSVKGGTLPFGPYVRGFYAIDTSGTDDSVPSVTVSFLSNGINRGTFTTDADGFFKINMPAGTWTAVGSKAGYVFIDTTFTISVSDTLDIRGYNIAIGSPAGGNQCRVFGYSQDILDTVDAMGDVWAYIELAQSVNNTCDSTIVTRFTKRKQVDATGLFTFDVAYSSCLSNAKYSVWLVGPNGQPTKKFTFTAPSSANYKVFWTGGGQ